MWIPEPEPGPLVPAGFWLRSPFLVCRMEAEEPLPRALGRSRPGPGTREALNAREEPRVRGRPDAQPHRPDFWSLHELTVP